jgi:carbon monoxide dehydrogenase subunit G
MERSEHTVEIEAPRERVFAWLVEPELMLRWIGGLREFHPLDPEPRRLVAAELDGKGFHVDTRHELEDDGAGTTLVRAEAHTRLSGLAGRFLGGLADRGAQRKLEGDLARLKQLLEDEAKGA